MRCFLGTPGSPSSPRRGPGHLPTGLERRALGCKRLWEKTRVLRWPRAPPLTDTGVGSPAQPRGVIQAVFSKILSFYYYYYFSHFRCVSLMAISSKTDRTFRHTLILFSGKADPDITVPTVNPQKSLSFLRKQIRTVSELWLLISEVGS